MSYLTLIKICAIIIGRNFATLGIIYTAIGRAFSQGLTQQLTMSTLQAPFNYGVVIRGFSMSGVKL